ncbi:MAG TPA: discoidin domain-containing protein [Tepidisphaeraceae bacterium]|jgi:hypothetical protein
MNRGSHALNLAVFSMMTVAFSTSAATAQPAVVSLAGSWTFSMAGPAAAQTQGALPTIELTDTIDLPGTTETRNKGPLNKEAGWTGQLTRVRKFEGTAWYEREIAVPENWRDKRITLLLERTKYTQVWLDGKPVGSQSILGTPQDYVLDGLTPGTHRLTIAVDNKRELLPGDNHQTSDNSQGNWNGIIGRIELRATDRVWIDDVQTYPDVPRRTVKVRARLQNVTGKSGSGNLELRATGKGVTGTPVTQAVQWNEKDGAAEIEIPLGDTAALWSEFDPAVHELVVRLTGDGVSDERKLAFGLRDFAVNGTQFTLNGKPTFLRGKHDGCVFPLTGHPPMDVEGWMAYYRTLKEWGINHVRCHSWIPPEAAFVAADRMGFFLQPELPFWGDYNDKTRAILQPEAEALLRHYGNHPSFVMLTLGNETRGSREIMASMVDGLRQRDPRHLYAQGSNAYMWDPQLQKGDNFLATARAKASSQGKSLNVRGSHTTGDTANGHIQIGPANTMTDYAQAIKGINGPVIGHEVGQWTVYPDFKEIAKYTGVTRANNLEHFRKRLQAAGMIDQAEDFLRATGALSALLYREEIETALRTPGFGGFQLLDLQDFPGQGTALVGMLNAFMESKNVVPAETWRQFCGPVVLLARFPKYTWTSGETFEADIQAAHYGEADLTGAALAWALKSADGSTLASGKLPGVDVAQGGVRPIGRLSVPLTTGATPAQVKLELQIEGTEHRTSYPLWVYPAAVAEPAGGVKMARTLDADARQTLAGGGRVLLVTDGQQPLARTVGGSFTTDFWCWPMFHNKPGTMGLLMDPKHPALASFPTEFHSNWQWFYLTRDAQPLVLNKAPAGYRPIVQTIDNLDRVYKLGLVFELKVGPGKLLVCATDLIAMKDRPEARQLLSSLQAYAASDQFDPKAQMSEADIRELLRATVPLTGTATASTQDRAWPGFQAQRAFDVNDDTLWRAAGARRRAGNFGEQTTGPGGERQAATQNTSATWWQVVFEKPQNLHAIEVLWEHDRPGYQYVVEGQGDGDTWRPLKDQPANAFTGGRHAFELNADGVRALRIRIIATPDNAPAGIREVRFFERDR